MDAWKCRVTLPPSTRTPRRAEGAGLALKVRSKGAITSTRSRPPLEPPGTSTEVLAGRRDRREGGARRSKARKLAWSGICRRLRSRSLPRFRRSFLSQVSKNCRRPYSDAISPHHGHRVMASAYKSATRTSDVSDSEAEAAISGSESSHTVEVASSSSGAAGDEVPTRTASAKLSQLPVELRNRILMLTSRGVSHR